MHFSLKSTKGVVGDWWRRFLHQWIKHYKLLFFLAFLLILGVGVFQWYYHLKRYAWSDEEKKTFLARTVKETSFQEEKFRAILESLADLRRAHEGTSPIGRDLFFGKRVIEK